MGEAEKENKVFYLRFNFQLLMSESVIHAAFLLKINNIALSEA